MKRRHWIASLTLSLVIQACGLSSAPTPLPPTATIAPSLTGPSAGSPTAVQTYVLPSITPSPTPPLALAFPKDQRLNCRYGPGTAYEIIGDLEVDQSARIAGRNADDSWWYVEDPGNPGTFCWIFAELTETLGNTSGMPVIAPPAVGVTKISVAVDPPHRSVSCVAFPQTFYVTAEISTNGPAIVNWRWEVSTGEVSADSTLTFTQSGTHVLEYYYQALAANDYVVQLHVLSPNEALGQINFRVDCTP
jgi:uncharacterized protein YraI